MTPAAARPRIATLAELIGPARGRPGSGARADPPIS